LIRLGKEPKGIVGSGLSTSDPEFGPHWDPAFKRQGKEALYVDLKFDFLSKEPLITSDELQTRPFSSVTWGIQASHVLLPESVTDELEQLWHRRTGGIDPILPEELFPNQTFAEGAQRTVVLNAYERNPQREGTPEREKTQCYLRRGGRFSEIRWLGYMTTLTTPRLKEEKSSSGTPLEAAFF